MIDYKREVVCGSDGSGVQKKIQLDTVSDIQPGTNPLFVSGVPIVMNTNRIPGLYLPDDLLSLVTEWLDSVDILALKNVSRALRLFVQEHHGTLFVSRVEIVYHQRPVDYHNYLDCPAFFQVFLSVGKRPGDHLGGLRVLGMNEAAMSFWNVIWDRSTYLHCDRRSYFLPRPNSFVLQMISNTFDLSCLPVGLPHPPLLRLKNCYLERIEGWIDSPCVKIQCPGIVRPIRFGKHVKHVKTTFPLGFVDNTDGGSTAAAFQFQNSASLETLGLVFDRPFVFPVPTAWGLRNVHSCVNVRTVIFKVSNRQGNLPDWFVRFNEALNGCLHPGRLRKVVLEGAINAIQHDGDGDDSFWQRTLGLNLPLTGSGGVPPDSRTRDVHLCFQGEDDLQLVPTPETQNHRKLKLFEMTLQLLAAKHLKTVELVLCSSSSSLMSPRTFQSVNMLAMFLMKAVSVHQSDKFSHLYVYQSFQGSVLSETMDFSNVEDLQVNSNPSPNAKFIPNANIGCTSDRALDAVWQSAPDKICVEQLILLFSAVVKNPAGVKFVSTDLPLPVHVLCDIVDAIATNPDFGCFTLIHSSYRLTYQQYTESSANSRSQKSPGLLQETFAEVVRSKLVYCG
jgi:hypothetical protein